MIERHRPSLGRHHRNRGRRHDRRPQGLHVCGIFRHKSQPEPAIQTSSTAQPSPWLIFLFLDLPPFFSFYRSLCQISISPVSHSSVSTFLSCSPFPVSRSTSLARWKAANPGFPGGGKDSERYPKWLSNRYQRKSQKTARGQGQGENQCKKQSGTTLNGSLLVCLFDPSTPAAGGFSAFLDFPNGSRRDLGNFS